MPDSRAIPPPATPARTPRRPDERMIEQVRSFLRRRPAARAPARSTTARPR